MKLYCPASHEATHGLALLRMKLRRTTTSLELKQPLYAVV